MPNGRTQFTGSIREPPVLERTALIFSIAKLVYFTTANIPKLRIHAAARINLFFLLIFSLYTFFSSLVIVSLLASRYSSEPLITLSRSIPHIYITAVAYTRNSEHFTLDTK